MHKRLKQAFHKEENPQLMFRSGIPEKRRNLLDWRKRQIDVTVECVTNHEPCFFSIPDLYVCCTFLPSLLLPSPLHPAAICP